MIWINFQGSQMSSHPCKGISSLVVPNMTSPCLSHFKKMNGKKKRLTHLSHLIPSYIKAPAPKKHWRICEWISAHPIHILLEINPKYLQRRCFKAVVKVLISPYKENKLMIQRYNWKKMIWFGWVTVINHSAFSSHLGSASSIGPTSLPVTLHQKWQQPSFTALNWVPHGLVCFFLQLNIFH